MADGALLLTWKNHHAAFCDILSRLREKETFTDVTLVCEGKFYPVHKLVLSACSEHLEKILENTKCRHPVIVLHGIKCSELESLLMFMYAGEVSVPQTSLSQLMHAAELLEVKGLAVPDVSPAVDSKKSKESKHSTSDSPPSKRRKHEDKSSEAERESQAWSSPPPSASSTRCKERKGNLKHSLGRDNRQLEMQEEEEQLATENQASDRTCVREAEAVDLEPIIKEEIEEIYYSDGLAMPEACLNDMNQSFEKDEGSILGSTEGSNQLGMSSDLQHQPSVHPKLCLPHQMPPTPVVMCNSSDSKEWAVESEVLDEIGTGNNNSLAGDDESLSMMADHPTSPQKQQMVNHDASGPRGVAGENWSSSETERQHTCPYCSYTTTQSSLLLTHVMSHTGHHLYSCKQCQYEFRDPMELKLHEQTHSTMKPHCCPHCHYRTAKKYNLQIHIRSHTGEKPFQCPYCPFRSTNRSDLRKHVYTHKNQN